MKIYYMIEYEVAGTRATDVICIYASSISEAVNKFCEVKQNHNNNTFTYNESAIIKIECY